MLRTPLITASFCLFVFTGIAQQPIFEDVSQVAGVQGILTNYALSVVDVDQDGLEDLYVGIKNQANRLYRNNGDGTFTNVAAAYGLADAGNTYTAIWADFDNDGDKDLYVGNYNQPNSYYINMGNGSFVEAAAQFGINNSGRCRCVITADVNRDGWLDIYVVNINEHNAFYLSDGSGGFIDWYYDSFAVDNLVGMGAVFFDSDNDGDVDLYLTHDAYQPNRLYINDGTGVFSNESFPLGAAHSGEGMGVDVTDYDHDGWLDIYITNNSDGNALLKNDGDGSFTNLEDSLDVADQGMGWGVAWFDYDLDGHKDLYMANNYAFSTFPNVLYRNLNGSAFEQVGLGSVLDSPYNGAAITVFDYDNDGDEDIAVANSLSVSYPGVQLFKNNTESGNHITFDLEGTVSNRDAIGTRLILYTDTLMQVDEHTGPSGYSQQNSERMKFGLGSREIIDSLYVRWPNGLEEVYYELEVNTTHYLVEGETLQPANTDVNMDFQFTVIDLLDFLSNFGCVGEECSGDLDGDADVDAYDLLLMLSGLFQ